MGKWVVIAQYASGESYRTELVARVTGSRQDARTAMRDATRTCRAPMREKWREVYRLPGGDSYLVIVKGAASMSEVTLTIAEMVYDSTDPAVEAAADAEDTGSV
ncbi:hypothetical protein AB0B30_32975 [Streptomyces narbonensis]|uniref:Uncharacterized protein n=1 Tax=Streptomyces narbonensis TaxID=67333 RepID=A0ABV3CIN2_9ACTN